jgi:hypothetical protein
MVQLNICAFDGHELLMTLFRLDASFHVPPPIPIGTPTRFWGVSSSSSTARSPSHPTPPLDLINHRLDLVNMVYSSHMLLLVDVPKYQPSRLVFWPSWSLDLSLTLVLHRSQSIDTRHASTWLSPCPSTIFVLHTRIPTQPREMLPTHSC